ncbi:MAG: alpha/beta fold hydrolase [Planctomycetota bacterium]
MLARLLEVAGAGPPVVYVPGIDGSGRYLLGTAARIAARFRLARLAYTAEIPPPPGGDTYSGLARSVLAGLDEAGFDRPLVLTESFGGAVALQLALDAPERVAGLLIVNSFAHYAWRRRLAVSRLIAPLLPAPLVRALRPVVAPRAFFHPRRDPAARRAFLATPPAAFDAGYRRRLRMIRELDLRPRLAEIRAPVALFASDRDRIVAAVPAATVLQEGLPDARLEILSGAGHLVLPLAAEPWPERLQELAGRAAALNRLRGIPPAP